MKIYRSEHPDPQFFRENYINLNGEWDFAFDFGKSGLDRKMQINGVFDKKINIPFCPESKLSGIGYTDFIPAVWYRREFILTDEQRKGRTLLHFGAVDYFCVLFINGEKAGSHSGGYSSFCFDITRFLKEGTNTVCLYCEDDVRSGKQPAGKQSYLHNSFGCYYTRTTGIWQTVWLEFVPKTYISDFKIYPNINLPAIDIDLTLSQKANAVITAEAFYQQKPAGKTEIKINGHNIKIHLPLNTKQLWECGKGRLYDLKLTLKNEQEQDVVNSYFGLREVSWGEGWMYLNGEKVFQKLVLDQGFYPDGIYTAAYEEDFVRDIQLSLDLGFNGARLHEKIFEPRFLYHTDRMGYLVWEEHANWSLQIHNGEGLRNFLPEWLEIVKRDFNHPSIIGWCPFNETWDGVQKQDDTVLSTVYFVTKTADPTRPVIDTSGNYHVITDIYDIHNYNQNLQNFKNDFEPMKTGGKPFENFANRQSYGGQPYFVSEFGGTKWSNEDGWGYGDAPKTEEEFVERVCGFITTLIQNSNICASCYTQLYDVEQEQNGLYTYSRQKKFSEQIYSKIKRANEEEKKN